MFEFFPNPGPNDLASGMGKLVDDKECVVLVRSGKNIETWHLYKTEDGGSNWEVLVRFPFPVPEGSYGGWELTVDKNERRVDVQLSAPKIGGGRKEASMSSKDFGETWEYCNWDGAVSHSGDNGQTWYPDRTTETSESPKPGGAAVSTSPANRSGVNAGSESFVLTASDLLDEYWPYKQAAADKKYNGKTLQVRGTVLRILSGSSLELGVQDGNGRRGGIYCYFGNNFSSEVAKVSKGQSIIVLGLCDPHKRPVRRDTMWVILENCELVSGPKSAAPETARQKGEGATNPPVVSTKKADDNSNRPTKAPLETNKPMLPSSERQKLTLDVAGVACGGCAGKIAAALRDGKLKPEKSPAINKTGLSRVIAEADKDVDLGAAAKKVNDAPTPHRDAGFRPGLSVVFFAKLDTVTAKRAEDTAGKVKGVDSKDTKADAEKGEIRVRIKGNQKVTYPDIQKALMNAGIESTLTKLDTKENAPNDQRDRHEGDRG